MDQYFDALQKSHTREGILGSVNESREEFLEKGKKAQIGEIRTWKGVKFQKQPNGGWIPVREQKAETSTEKKVDSYEEIKNKMLSAKEGITGGAEGTMDINGFKVHYDLDFEDKTITIHIKDSEGKPVIAKDIQYNRERTKEAAIKSAIRIIKEHTGAKGHYEEFVDADTGEVVKLWKEDTEEASESPIEKEPELDYHSYEERANAIRKEYGPIEDGLRNAKSDLSNKIQERRELQMEMEQEVGALYVQGKDIEAETLAQDYGERFNKIDDEIDELKNKISELKPKVREMEDRIDEIWLH